MTQRRDASASEADLSASWEARWSAADFSPFWLTTAVPKAVERALAAGQFRPGDTLLDIGCGRGDLAAYLARIGFKVTGLDFAKSAVEMAVERYGGAEGSATFLHRDFCEPLPKDFTFRCVLDRGCLHAVPRPRRAVYLSNLARCVTLGGHFLLLHRTSSPDRVDGTVSEIAAERIAAHFLEHFEIIWQEAIELGASITIPGVAIMMTRRDDSG